MYYTYLYLLYNTGESLPRQTYYRGELMTYVLFDLDGTLSDSREGIINSYVAALTQTGHEVKDRNSLLKFIGPPIMETFRNDCKMDERTAEIANKCFQERYATLGKFENHLYPGIVEMLEDLNQKGCILGVATSKPEKFAKEILIHFGINRFFNTIVGASMDDTLSKKTDILHLALTHLNISPMDTVYMVGDRSYDMNAAKTLNTKAIGVTYGFGSEEELENSGADFICHTPQEIVNVIS